MKNNVSTLIAMAAQHGWLPTVPIHGNNAEKHPGGMIRGAMLEECLEKEETTRTLHQQLSQTWQDAGQWLADMQALHWLQCNGSMSDGAWRNIAEQEVLRMQQRLEEEARLRIQIEQETSATF